MQSPERGFFLSEYFQITIAFHSLSATLNVEEQETGEHYVYFSNSTD